MNITKPWKFVLFFFIIIFLFSSVMAISAVSDSSPFKEIRISTQNTLQGYLDGAKDRYLKNKSTTLDRFMIWSLTTVGTGTIGSLAPEAQHIMLLYLFGDGQPMIDNSDYYSQSHYLKNLGEKMRVGDKLRDVWIIPTSKDYRLAMAVNGFNLSKGKNHDRGYTYTLTRRIDFPDQRWAVFTFHIGKYKIKFYDMLVHLMKPTPFDYSTTWDSKI